MSSLNVNKLLQPECGGSNPLVAAAQQIAMKPAAGVSGLGPRRAAPVNFSREFISAQKNNAATLNQLARAAALNAQAQSGRPGQLSSQLAYQGPAAQQQQPQQQQQQQQQQQHHHQQQQQQGRLASEFLAEQQICERVQQVHIEAPVTQLLAARRAALAGVRAGGGGGGAHQLDAKYREDLMAAQEEAERVLQRQGGDTKADDTQFWQSLAQRYVGPTAAGEGPAAATLAGLDVDAWMGGGGQAESLLAAPEEYIFDDKNPLKQQFDDPFGEGLQRLSQGDIPSAALLFEAAVQLDGARAEAWRYLGTTQAQNEKDSAAIRALARCLSLEPRDQEARLAIAVSLANEGRRGEACDHLVEWLHKHPQYSSLGASAAAAAAATSASSSSSLEEQRQDYVRDKFMEAARLQPNNPDPEVQSALGVLFSMRGLYDKACDCFRAALSVRAGDALLWNRLGATLANGNKSDQAVLAYRKALELAPGFLRSRYNLAISLVHLNIYDEAAKQLVQILNSQAAGEGPQRELRARSLTSGAVWNTLRTVCTLLNRPDLYPVVEGRNLAECNRHIFSLAAR